MANSNFIVKNGLTVGALTIDAATGNLNTTGTISGDLATSTIARNDSSIALNDTGTGSDIAVTIDGVHIFDITGSGIVPTVASNGTTGFDLGSASYPWRDVFVSSGSLYVNGQKVLQEDSGNIVVSADADQNLVFQTSGSGNLELDPTGTGIVAIKGTLQVEGGNNITSSDGNPLSIANGLKSDSMTSRSTNTDLTITANGTGAVRVDDDMVVTGNLTISGTTTTVNTATLSVADNIVDLNSDFTTGTPSENAGLRVLRGDSASVQIRWNEGSDAWEFTNDGSSYGAFASTAYADQAETDAKAYTDTRESAITSAYTSAIATAVAAKDNTDEITEGSSNLYFTTARARSSISVTGAATYNSSTGVINVTGGVTSVAGKTGAVTFTHNHSSAYVVTSANSSSNASASLALSAATLGFDCSDAVTYQVYLNRLLVRPSEVTVNTSNGTLTFAAGVLATDDEIEVVWMD